MMRHIWLQLLAGLSCLFLYSASVPATSLNSPAPAARAVSMGAAFTAVADDSSSIYYNPAGMSQFSGTDIKSDAHVLFPSMKYTMPTGVTEKSTKGAVVPSLFITHSFSDRISAGLGLYSPYGNCNRYGNDPANGFKAQRTLLVRIDLSPVVSFKINEHFSVGGGLVASYSMLDRSVPASAIMDIKDNIDGTGVGGTAGGLWRINKYIKVGAAYRSKMTIEHSGDRTIEVPGIKQKAHITSDFPYPNAVALGLVLMPKENWIVSLDADWYEWSVLDKVTAKSKIWPDAVVVINADDCWEFKAGTEYMFSNGCAIRVGYEYLQRAIPPEYIMPAASDQDFYVISAGVGKKIKNWDFDIVYSYAAAVKLKTESNIYGFNGEYDFVTHLATAGAKYHF